MKNISKDRFSRIYFFYFYFQIEPLKVYMQYLTYLLYLFTFILPWLNSFLTTKLYTGILVHYYFLISGIKCACTCLGDIVKPHGFSTIFIRGNWWKKIESGGGIIFRRFCYDLDLWPRNFVQGRCTSYTQRHYVDEVWARLSRTVRKYASGKWCRQTGWSLQGAYRGVLYF